MTFQLPCQIIRQLITKEPTHNPERLVKTLYQINQINSKKFKFQNEKADLQLELKKFLHTKPKNIYDNTLNIKNFKNISNLQNEAKKNYGSWQNNPNLNLPKFKTVSKNIPTISKKSNPKMGRKNSTKFQSHGNVANGTISQMFSKPKTQNPSTQVFRRYSTLLKKSRKNQKHVKKPLLCKGPNPRILATPRFLTSLKTFHFHKNYSTKSKFFKFPYTIKRRSGVLDKTKMPPTSKLVDLRSDFFRRFSTRPRMFKFLISNQKEQRKPRSTSVMLPKIPKNPFPTLKRLKKIYAAEKEQSANRPVEEPEPLLRADDNLKPKVKKLPKFKPSYMRSVKMVPAEVPKEQLRDWKIPQPKKRFDETTLETPKGPEEEELPVCRLDEIAGLTFYERKKLPSLLPTKKRKVTIFIDKIVAKCRENGMEPRLDDLYWVPKMKKLPSLLHTSFRNYSTLRSGNFKNVSTLKHVRHYSGEHANIPNTTCKSDESQNPCYPRVVVQKWPTRVKKGCLKRIDPVIWEKMPPYPFHKSKDCYNPHEKWLNECFKIHWKYLQPHRQKREAGPIINFKYPVYGFLRYQSDQSPRTVTGELIPKTRGLPMLKRLQGCNCNNKVFPCPREERPEPKRVEPPYPSFSECKGDDYVKPLSECHEYVIEKAPTPWPEPPKICPPDPAFDGPRPPCGHYIRRIKDELQDTKKLEAHPSPCGENIARGSDVHTNAKRYYSTVSNDISLRDYITRIRNLLSKPNAFKNITDQHPSWGILKTNSAPSPEVEKPVNVVEDGKTDNYDPKILSVEPQPERNESFIVATAPSMQKRNFSKTQLVEKIETQKVSNFPVDFSNPYELGKENCQNYLNQTENKFSSGFLEEKLGPPMESRLKELEIDQNRGDISLEPKKGEISFGKFKTRELSEGFLNRSVAKDDLKDFEENKFVETGTNHASSTSKEPLRSTEVSTFPEGFSKYGLRAKMRYLMNLENNSTPDSKFVRKRSLELLRTSEESKSLHKSKLGEIQTNENGLEASQETILMGQNKIDKNKDVPGLSKYGAIATPTKPDLPERFSHENNSEKYEPNELLMGSRLEYLVSGPKVAKIRSFLEERFKSLVEPKPKVPLEGKNQNQGTINHQTPEPILISPAKCDTQNVSTDLDKKQTIEESSKSEVPKRFPNHFGLGVIRENKNPTHHPLEIKVEGFGNEEELKIGPKLSPVVIKKTSLTDPLKSGEFMQYLKAEKNPESKEVIQSLKESYSKGPIHLKNICAKNFMGPKDSHDQRSTLMEPGQLLKVEGGNCPIVCLKKNYSEGPINLKDISGKIAKSVPDAEKYAEEPDEGVTIKTCSKVIEKNPENSPLGEEVKISVVEPPNEISVEKYEQIGDSKRCSELSTNVFLSGNGEEPSFADLFTKASLCRVQRRNISTIRRQCHQSKPTKFKCSPKYYISTLDQTCDEIEVLKPKSPSISPNRTKKRKCCFPEVNLRDDNRCVCPKLRCKEKSEDPCGKFKKCTWKAKKRSSVCNFCKPKSPCSNLQVKTCPKLPPPPGCAPLSLFERIKNYFKARPGCPTPEEARQKELLQKAEAAAAAVGMRLCEKKRDPCAEPEDKCCRKYSTFRRSSGFFQRNETLSGVQGTDGKSPLTKVVPNSVPDSKVRVQRSQNFSTYQDPLTKSVPTYVTLSPKYSTFQKRSNLGENRENAQEIGSLTKTTTRIVPVAAPKYIGKMYQVKLSKIGVRNKLTTKQIEEEPYTYCQICRIVPKNGTHLP